MQTIERPDPLRDAAVALQESGRLALLPAMGAQYGSGRPIDNTRVAAVS